MTKNRRIDVLMVEQGLTPSREKARRLIMAGAVVADHHRVDKAGTLVPADALVRIKASEQLPFVSRGGQKLERALVGLRVDVGGAIALDVGASTGGFTDCLLVKGAAKVFAVDVGYGQLHWRLRCDPRVVNMERRNIRNVVSGDFDMVPTLAVIDVSFISLKIVMPLVIKLLSSQAKAIALVKPQFEVGKGRVGKGGVVRDPLLHAEVLDDIQRSAKNWPVDILGVVESPILGAKGNKEFFLGLHKRSD